MGIIGMEGGVNSMHAGLNSGGNHTHSTLSGLGSDAQRQQQRVYDEFISRQQAQAQQQQAYFSPHNVWGQQEQCYSSCATSFPGAEDPKELERRRKAENKAVLLLQNMIGAEQCDIYRGSHRILLKPGRYLWIVGNIFKGFDSSHPFRGKPDVVRVDSEKKRHYTSFCVDQVGEATPYTDKVISFCAHLINSEKRFLGLINRIKEDTFDKIPKCAQWV